MPSAVSKHWDIRFSLVGTEGPEENNGIMDSSRFIMRLRWMRGAVFALCLLAMILIVRHYYDGKAINTIVALPMKAGYKLSIMEAASAMRNNNNTHTSEKKIILLYSTWFHEPYWAAFKGDLLRTEFNRCPRSKNCIATYNKSQINVADVLLFHGRDVESSQNYRANILQDLRKNAPVKQKWIFLSHETPQWNVNFYKQYDGIFNWTATFSRDSDVFVPYTRYIKFDKPKNETKVNYAKGKSRLVAWAVTNCLKTRQDYALELQRYIDLTVYGGCGRHFKNHGSCRRGEPACEKEMASYKFYLAFENAFCQDWVSEKYWRTVGQNVVPVVMGANYDEGAAIPGSFIDVSDFKSIKELANYLLYLDQNDDAYNKYFSWKTQYGFAGESMYCSICQELHSEKFTKTSQVTLSEVFSAKNNCGKYRYREERIQTLTQESKRQK